MTTYWLRAIYEDKSTNLGTFGNEVFKGIDIKKKVKNFKEKYMDRTNMAGLRIIGVEVETCHENKYAEGKFEKFIFDNKD